MRWWASPSKRLLVALLALLLSVNLFASTEKRASNSLGQNLGPYAGGLWSLVEEGESRYLYYDDTLHWEERVNTDGDLVVVERIFNDGVTELYIYHQGVLQSKSTPEKESSYIIDPSGKLLRRLESHGSVNHQVSYVYDEAGIELLHAYDAMGTLIYSHADQESSVLEISGYNRGQTGSLAAIGEVDPKERVVQVLVPGGNLVKHIEYRSDGSRIETFIVGTEAYCEVLYGPYSERVLSITYL